MQDPTSPIDSPTSPISPISPRSPNQAHQFAFRSHKRAHSLLSPTTPTIRSPPPQRQRLTLAPPSASSSSYTHKATQCPSPSITRSSKSTAFPLHFFPPKALSNPPSCTRQRKVPQPSLTEVLDHLHLKLIPLVSVTNGRTPANFPKNLLQFHLLTHSDLDQLARHYHQVWPPLPYTHRYPASMKTWVWNQDLKPKGRDATVELKLETKRRRFGRFIGLRGCESPTRESFVDWSGAHSASAVEEEKEKEWCRALERAREEEIRMEKMWKGI